MTSQPADRDGRHDFNFLFGKWRIANRRLVDPLADGSQCVEFESTADARPILGGLGNGDSYFAPDFPGRGSFHGFALRLYDMEARVWRIWWASSGGGGQLDTPVVGRFVDGEGRFECDDVLGDRRVRVRFVWKDITPVSARWEQFFSFDEGASFELNWIMQFTRDSLMN